MQVSGSADKLKQIKDNILKQDHAFRRERGSTP